MSKIGKAAGIKVYVNPKDPEKVKYASAHDLRRAFGVRWAARLMPAQLMELMRHESIETTLRFCVGTDAQRTADAPGWHSRRASGYFRDRYLTNHLPVPLPGVPTPPTPSEARPALEITEPDRSRPGVPRTPLVLLGKTGQCQAARRARRRAGGNLPPVARSQRHGQAASAQDREGC